MATNGKSGDNRRHGAVRDRSQTQTPSGHWVKRDADTGRFMDVKTSDNKPFKGVRKEKQALDKTNAYFRETCVKPLADGLTQAEL